MCDFISVNADTPLSPKTVSLKLSSLSVPEKSTKKGPTTPGGGASNSKKGPVKTTRSKAWLDEYASSDDPVKIYFGDVYSYHDNAGEYIAQPFIDLPSKKDYPEYYRVITEPIGLSIIRSQLEAGYYCNLKAIQDDLLLMIKNAQYFNEPQSAIYKMAGTLRRFIISRCLELERKYRTVEKTAKLKSPSPGLSGSRDVLQKHSDTDSDGVSDSDSNADDSEGEGKQRLLLHIKRDTSSSKTKDPLAKILRAKSLPSSRKLYLACYRAITRATDNDGRVISELFMKRPSAKLYPEYYIVIKSPIDFKEIYSKIKNDLYKTLLEMMDDVELLVNNAITFNEEYSQIHTDALAIRALSVKVMEQIQSKWPQLFTGVTRKVHPMLSQISSISTLFAVIKNSIDSSGRKIWLSLQDVPPPSREGESYCGGKKPVGLANIGQKVDSNNYQSVDDLFSDLCYLFECYCDHYSSQHQLYKDAVSLHRLSVTKYNELTHEQRASYQYPSAPDVVKKMLKDIMNSLMEAKDGDGNRLCDVLQPVIVCQEHSTDEDKTKRVFTIDKLSQWVNGGRYSRLDQLQVDILSIFREARQKNKEFGREMIKASLTFERQYITIRDEICSNILWSSALTDRTLQHVEDEGEEMEGSLDEVDDDNTIQMESLTIPSSGDRIIKDSHRIGDVVYHPGDFVYLPPREPHLPSQIALIESTWMDKVGNSWFDGCWFFRPHETFHPATRKFYEHEVFKSDFYSSALLSSVIGKCFVLFIKDYTKFYPQGFSEEDVYVCESRYIYKHKSIKKIKFWNVQQNVHVKLLPRLAPCPLNKVPSVFATSIDKSDEELQMSKGSSCISKDIKTPDDDDLDSNSSGSLERSFFRELKEVTVIVNNPEDNCTYFQQYCIDDKIFKLGDFVYVRSDQAQPFIARIDRMWTDSNEDPWFHGPWFVRTTEIEHVPTHMFYEKELFMSNIQDTNPMRSIIRKCAVLHPTDFVKWRPTEILETDVYVCESKYNEDEKLLKKMKNLKVCDCYYNQVKCCDYQ
jgi:protein polybromo-1